MRKTFKWMLCAIGGIVGAAVLLWSAARLSGPTADQHAALALMQQPWKPSGRNAFPMFWQLAYDVPEQEQAAVAEEDLRRMAATPPPGTVQQDGESASGLHAYRSVAAERHAGLTLSKADRALLCGAREPGCLERVRTSLPRYQDLVDRNAQLFDRVASLADYDHYRNPLPPRADVPMSPSGVLIAPKTRHAVAFVRGEVDTALSNTCRDISTWRRLGANADSILMRMVGIGNATDAYGLLLAEMLAELPLDHALPAICARAVAPAPADELRICRAMRGEFAVSSEVMRTSFTQHAVEGPLFNRVLMPLVFDADATIAEMATFLAPACSQQELRRIEADAPATGWTAEQGLWRLQCAGNLGGCILLESSATQGYSDYALRAQDQGARLKLLATLLWLRQTGAQRSINRKLSERPDALKSPSRDIEVDAGGRGLRIRQFEDQRSEYWTAPLPRPLWRSGKDS